ncbi:MAG: cadherin-like domain-containing protein, partial [Bacteroidia bacterium]
MKKYIQSIYRVSDSVKARFVLSFGMLTLLLSLLTSNAQAQTCDFLDTDSITFNQNGGATSGFDALYILASNGTIIDTSSTQSFPAQAAGVYEIYAGFYLPTVTPTGIAAGSPISGVVLGNCSGLTTSGLSWTVCPSACDLFVGDSISFNILGGNIAGYESLYLLADSAGNIVQTSTTESFNPVSFGGIYFIYAAYYSAGEAPSNSGVGSNIVNLSFPGSCSGLSGVLLLKICDNRSPLAQDDINNTLVDTPVDGNLLTNDKDPDGDPLTASATPITPPANGSVVINPDGSYTYTPDPAFEGEDSFVYEVCDPFGNCDQATVSVEVIPVPDPGNDEPIANNDATETPTDTPVNIPVLSNDFDPDGDPLSNPTIVTPPTNGSVVVNPDGTLTYTPNPGFEGEEVLSYQSCDPNGA